MWNLSPRAKFVKTLPIQSRNFYMEPFSVLLGDKVFLVSYQDEWAVSYWKFMFFWQGLTPYEKKKYVWKMLYIFMLGYDVDFGHMEAVSLISAPKYPEKQVRSISFSL